jgi:hypothetical protein
MYHPGTIERIHTTIVLFPMYNSGTRPPLRVIEIGGSRPRYSLPVKIRECLHKLRDT